jgi:hypothetical protein
VLRQTIVLALLIDLLLPASSFAQNAAQQPAREERFHPYKKAGVLMIGLGAIASVAAVQRIAGLEGPNFQACTAAATTAIERAACPSLRTPNPTLSAVGVILISGGLLIALQRAARTPERRIGRGHVALAARIEF